MMYLFLTFILLYISFGFVITTDEKQVLFYFSRVLLFPVAFILGKKYSSKGVVTSLVILSSAYFLSMTYFSFVEKYWYITDSIYFRSSNDISIYIGAFLASSLAAYKRVSLINSGSLPLIGVIILLFIPSIAAAQVKFNYGYYLVFVYVFLVGYCASSSEKHTNLLIVILAVFVIDNTIMSERSDSIFSFKALNNSMGYYISIFLVYMSGFYTKNINKLPMMESKKSSRFVVILSIAVAIFISHSFKFYGDFSYINQNIFIIKSGFLIYTIAFFLPFFYRKTGLYIIITYYLIFIVFSTKVAGYMYIPMPEIGGETYGKELSYMGFSINTKISFSHIISAVSLSLLGFFFKDIIKKKYYSRFSSYSTIKIMPYMLAALIISFFSLLMFILMGSDIDPMSLSDIFYAFEEDQFLYILIFISMLYYLVFILFPVGLASIIVERNGVEFNRANFPEFTNIHNIIDEEFKKERAYRLYIVSTNKIGLWSSLASSFLKLYSSFLPFISSSTFNEISRGDDRKLLYVVYKEHLKINLYHYKLWWFLYPLTFFPILNFIYTYARRKLYLQISLYAYYILSEKSLISFSSTISSIYSEEIEVSVRGDNYKESKNNIFAIWLEYFSPRPHTKTLISLIDKYESNRKFIHITKNGNMLNFRDDRRNNSKKESMKIES